MDVCVADPSQVKFYDVLAKKDPKKKQVWILGYNIMKEKSIQNDPKMKISILKAPIFLLFIH